MRVYDIYSFKFPTNEIYVGYTWCGLDYTYDIHKRCSVSPVYEKIKEFPNIKPELELTNQIGNLYKIQRQIFEKYPNMKILNVNLWLYGY